MYLKLLGIVLGFSFDLLASERNSQEATQVLTYEEPTTNNTQTQDLLDPEEEKNDDQSDGTADTILDNSQETHNNEHHTGGSLVRMPRIPEQTYRISPYDSPDQPR